MLIRTRNYARSKTVLLSKSYNNFSRFDASSNNFVWYMSEKDKLQMSYQKGSPGAKRMANMNIDQSQLSKYLTNDTSSLLFKTLGKLCSLGNHIIMPIHFSTKNIFHMMLLRILLEYALLKSGFK